MQSLKYVPCMNDSVPSHLAYWKYCSILYFLVTMFPVVYVKSHIYAENLLEESKVQISRSYERVAPSSDCCPPRLKRGPSYPLRSIRSAGIFDWPKKKTSFQAVLTHITCTTGNNMSRGSRRK